jgi:hypothetical protein
MDRMLRSVSRDVLSYRDTGQPGFLPLTDLQEKGALITMKSFVFAAGFIVLFHTQILYAQSPDTAWTKTYGGVDEDGGRSVQQTVDGGYIVAGYTLSYGAGSYDFYLIKTNSIGDTLWTKTYGGSAHDIGQFVRQTTDEGYIFTGWSGSYSSSSDVYLIKTNSNGDALWTKTFGGTDSDVGYSVQQTIDGGYIVTGKTESYGSGNSDVYLIKTNSTGDTLWTRTFGGTDSEFGNSVQQTTDGGYIIAGFTWSFGAGVMDVYLVKTNSSGDTLWTETFGGASYDYGNSVQQTTDGGYIIVGSTESFGSGYFDIYLIKTDSSGNALWTKTFGGVDFDYGRFVQQTTDGGYIVTGNTESYSSGNSDVYLIKTDSIGNTLWTESFGGSGLDAGYSIQQTTDGGYIITGLTSSYGAGFCDVYLIKLEPETGIENLTEGNPLFKLESICPNPFSSNLSITYSIQEQTSVELVVFDLSGRLVEELTSDQLPAGSYTAMWNTSHDTPNGCYLVVLDACGHREARRCLKLN